MTLVTITALFTKFSLPEGEFCVMKEGGEQLIVRYCDSIETERKAIHDDHVRQKKSLLQTAKIHVRILKSSSPLH